ncbi:Autophagy-related protein 22 [Penicillium subrubescens]|uniref:Autophagy-related protein n=1 Tax=Penicillium subrubescens TaxID=1316194 RepID=A0A1Q5SZ79_9EURO|nr:Autophagy-related protein 22 [Penicillium subrubescens]
MTGTDQVPKDDPKVAPRTVIEQLILADEVLDKNIAVAPGQIDEKYRTTKREIWAYYAYYIGNNGLSLFTFQNLLYQAAGESGTLVFLGKTRSINSVVLLSNGISFAIQIMVFLVIGSFADFGNWRPNILIALSVIAYAIGLAWLGVHTEDKWHIGVGLYIVGLIAYQTTLTFWTAAFPSLARNTVEMTTHADDLASGRISREEYEFADTMKRSQLANVAFYVQSVGEVGILAVIVGIMFGVDVNASTANNNWGLSYFLLGDSLNTTVTVISTLQNSIVAYNTLQLTYLLIVGIAAQVSTIWSTDKPGSNLLSQAVGIYAFWFIQQQYKFGTKTMFNAIAFSIILLDGWGMIGIWTSKFGFHHEWEVWFYQAFYGLLICPWYSYSQIMISEVTPRGYEYLFFSLFSIVGKTSSFIGPIVSSAIIDASPSGNTSMPFYFLFALSLLSFVILFEGVDLKKSRLEQEQFLEANKRKIGG